MSVSARGAFITLEGGEGAGKSTQIRALARWLEVQGIGVVATREPGGSPGAERIRSLLLDKDAPAFDPVSQALLFAAARRDHLRATIRPALERGAFVVCDRFLDSTRAYQGAGGALDPAVIRQLETIAVGATSPDLTLILDLDPGLGMARARQRLGASLSASDAFERQALDFHQRVRDEFLAIAKSEPDRCAIIDASLDADAVALAVIEAVKNRLASFLPGRGA